MTALLSVLYPNFLKYIREIPKITFEVSEALKTISKDANET